MHTLTRTANNSGYLTAIARMSLFVCFLFCFVFRAYVHAQEIG